MTAIKKLIEDFAFYVALQTDAMKNYDAKTGNKYAKRYIAAFKKLREQYGDQGRDALSVLFDHERADVRTMAAAFLLRYMTEKALGVLERESKGEGFIAFEASEAIKRWREGANTLDPLDPE